MEYPTDIKTSNQVIKPFDAHQDAAEDDEYYSDNEELIKEDEDDDLEDNLVDAEALDKFRKMQRSPNKENRMQKGKSESGLLLRDSSSQGSLGNDSDSHFEKQKPFDQNIQYSASKTFEGMKQKISSRKKSGIRFTKIKSFQDSMDGPSKYVVSAKMLAKYESDILELLGVKSEPLIQDKIYSSESIVNSERSRSKLIEDMIEFEKELSLNSYCQTPLLKTVRNVKNEHSKDELQKNLEFESKVITVVLNRPTRPRPAGRLLLTKKNTISLDNVLNDITNMFKAHGAQIRKLFNLRGVHVTELENLFGGDDLFLGFGSDKVHMKDFDLTKQEIEIIYALEYIKTHSYIISENDSNRKPSSSGRRFIKTKARNSKLGKFPSEDIQSMPKELLDNYEIGAVIGEGNYALVRECKDINTGIKFALKTIDLKKCVGKEEMIENELSILRKVIHSNIIKLVEDYQTNEFVYMVLEFYKGGDLLEALAKRGGKYTEWETSQIVHCMGLAISYLHSINIVHRDIKLENIFIQQFPDNSISLKLGDFGLATFYNGPLTQKCGSPIYVAPEILQEKSYGFEVDVWSLGIITYVLLCGYAPFQGETDEETFSLIKTQPLIFSPRDWDHVSPEVVDLIKKMLDRDQETRIKASEVADFKWPMLNTTTNNQNVINKQSINPKSNFKAAPTISLKAGNFKK